MIDGTLWAIDGIDTGDWVREDVNKVTEQDVKRAQSDSAQAKKVQEQIKKTKKENNNIADFLSFLLKNIKNEDIISAIYATFFKVTDPRTKTSYLRKSVNNLVIIWFFVPFFSNELDKFWLKPYFDGLYSSVHRIPNMGEYISYIKKLSNKYHDNIPIDQGNLLELLALIIWEFWISKEALEENGRKRIIKDIEKRLK